MKLNETALDFIGFPNWIIESDKFQSFVCLTPNLNWPHYFAPHDLSQQQSSLLHLTHHPPRGQLSRAALSWIAKLQTNFARKSSRENSPNLCAWACIFRHGLCVFAVDCVCTWTKTLEQTFTIRHATASQSSSSSMKQQFQRNKLAKLRGSIKKASHLPAHAKTVIFPRKLMALIFGNWAPLLIAKLGIELRLGSINDLCGEIDKNLRVWFALCLRLVVFAACFSVF